MNKLKDEWEKRSRELGNTYESVMFASFPKSINEMFHQWELEILQKNFPKKENVKVLDIGCGYGRLSLPLAKKFKTSKFYGIDISSGYIKLFNKSLGDRGEGKVGDLKTLPYKDDTFDYIFVVTVLMYMSDAQIKKLFSEINRVLKSDGKLVVIENDAKGSNYITGFGLSSFLKKLMGKENKHYVNSRRFKAGEIEKLSKGSFQVTQKVGCSELTMSLPFLLASAKMKLMPDKMKMNANIRGLFSLYNAYVLRKN